VSLTGFLIFGKGLCDCPHKHAKTLTHTLRHTHIYTHTQTHTRIHTHRHKLAGAGSSKARGKRFKSDMLAGGVFSVLTRISAAGAFFVLGADNFVRTCVVRNGIGRHGSYMIGDYTSLIVTILMVTAGFPVVLKALAQTLKTPVTGCWRCTADIEKDEKECCLECGALGMKIDYYAGAKRAKQFMTRRVHTAKFPFGPRALNIDSDVLPNTPENLTHTATMAAQSIARSTFALLQIESAYMDQYAARRANKIHDPNLVEHVDLRLHGSSLVECRTHTFWASLLSAAIISRDYLCSCSCSGCIQLLAGC
jgi:hypothetical protein